MGKVIEEHYVPFIGVDESENRLVIYRDSTDEEGYGVVFGDHDSDRTIAFGYGSLAEDLSIFLFDAMVSEVSKFTENGAVDENRVFDFEFLESPYNKSDSDNPLFDTFDEVELIKIIKYIAKYKEVE